jgi:alkylated DNA repair dioxygenase AlkB
MTALDLITYDRSAFADTADEIFRELTTTLPWVRRDSTPRMECFYSTVGLPYTYGSGNFSRTYNPEPVFNDLVMSINEKVKLYNTDGGIFELCFLNRYLTQRDHLGWHADDSPEIAKDKPIVVVTFGAEREIWFKRIGKDENDVESVLLHHGSVLVMPAGFQQTHLHRIPKSGNVCGERISLTFRGCAE